MDEAVREVIFRKFFFYMVRRPPKLTLFFSSAGLDVYKRPVDDCQFVTF